MENKELEQVLKALDKIIENVEKNDDPFKGVKPFPGISKLKKIVRNFENGITDLLDKQKRHIVSGVKGYKDDSLTTKIISYLTKKVFAKDMFQPSMEKLSNRYLEISITTILPDLIESIDKDVPYDGRISKKTNKWIKDWSKKLAYLMNTQTQGKVKNTIIKAIEDELTIEEVAHRLEYLPDFNRTRARRVAATEVLAASEQSKHEAYLQSPIVIGKVWHSHTAVNYRKEHKKLDGTMIGVDEDFDINGHHAPYPRSTQLPVGERVNCRCSTSPVIDKKKAKDLTQLQKLQIRDQRLRGN